MKINGKVMVSFLMYQMEVGDKGFLNSEAIIVSGGKVFINTQYAVSERKNKERGMIIPIIRTGPGKEDFELDFNITYSFYNQFLSEDFEKAFQENEYIIGPYNVEIETYRISEYRTKLYPKMDYNELLDTLIAINQTLGEDFMNSTTDDKDIIVELIKNKLQQFSLLELESEIYGFQPVPEEKSDNGNLINYLEDDEIEEFINKKIEEKKESISLHELSIPELDEELTKAKKDENYKRAAVIRDLIKEKTCIKN